MSRILMEFEKNLTIKVSAYPVNKVQINWIFPAYTEKLVICKK